MARVEIYTCNGCGTPAPERHSFAFPASTWYVINGGHSTEANHTTDFSMCSLDCLVKVARRLRGDDAADVAADELEVLFAAPAAPRRLTPAAARYVAAVAAEDRKNMKPAAPRKPRAPRKPKAA